MTQTDLERRAGRRIVRSFEGARPTRELTARLRRGRAGGVGLYRALNVESPEQLRALTAALQEARPDGDPPLLVALDQEGGQLQAFGDGATAWPGNLAIGATASEPLARRAGQAIGRELAAVGVNVVWAPVCDLLSGGNVVMGTRPFGDDPLAAGRLAAAMVRGIQSAGVAATIKHVPGHGRAAADSHYELPVVESSAEEIHATDLVPFRSAIRAGPRLAMVGHLAVPALIGDRTTATTFSPAIATSLLRDELGFRGVSVSDALNMLALGPLDAAPEHTVRAAAAGLDLLLLLHTSEMEERATDALIAALAEGRLDTVAPRASERRIVALRRWIAARAARVGRPSLDVVGCAGHVRLAREIAEAAVTLVRDRDGLVPLGRDRRPIIVVAPRPVDLTPADTSSYLRFGLAGALRDRGLDATELEMPLDPESVDVDALRAAAAGRTAIVGTVDATVHAGQAGLVHALVADRVPVVAVALRTPFDLAAYPVAGTYACSYGIQPPSIAALADALVGRIPFRGRLPVRLPAELAA